MNAYIERVIEQVKKRDAHEPEFIQTVEEVFSSIEKEVEQHPEYEKMGLLERLVEPERQISFRVTWVDDAGKVQVNRGFMSTVQLRYRSLQRWSEIPSHSILWRS